MESSSHLTPPYPVLLLVVGIITILFTQTNWIKRNNSRAVKLPPGPWKLPLIGSMHHLIGREHLHHRLTKLAKTYGPLMSIKLGEINGIIISSPDLACEVLKTHDVNFASRPLLLTSKIIFYNGSDLVFAPSGKLLLQLRKICTQHLLSINRVKHFNFIREEENNILVDKIRSEARYGPVNITKEIVSMANRIIAKAAFGKETTRSSRFMSAMKDALKLSSGFSIADAFPSLGILAKITGLRAEMEIVHRNIDATLNEIIVEHQAKHQSIGNECLYEDLVDVLLKISNSGDLDIALTTENIKGVILDLIIAGTETISNVIIWAMAELIRHPKAMQKVQREAKNALKGIIKYDDQNFKEIPYLSCVIKETLRLHPPIPLLLPRLSKESINISGYSIPSNSHVIINVGSIMKDSSYWDDPEKFLPERFEGSALDFTGSNFVYLPFGSGRRNCLGATFSKAIVEHSLAILLFHFDWGMPNGKKAKDLDMEESFGANISKKNDLYLLATLNSLHELEEVK